MPGNILRHFILSHFAFPSPLYSALLHQYLNIWNRETQNCFFSFRFSGSPDDHVINRKPIACEKSCFSMLLAAGDVSQGGTSATQRQKFHTDDINQCLHNKSGSHGVLNANLFNFTFVLVDFGKVWCSSAKEL